MKWFLIFINNKFKKKVMIFIRKKKVFKNKERNLNSRRIYFHLNLSQQCQKDIENLLKNIKVIV